ncbi:MAG: hypothetical protein ACTS27_07410 [Phycisphaerales bacterium]
MTLAGCYWLYSREMPREGWPERLRAWLSKHGCMPKRVSYIIEESRDDIVRGMYDDCVEHGFSARAFVDLAEHNLGDRSRAAFDDALELASAAPRWNMWLFDNDFGWRIYHHMKPRRPRPDDLMPVDLSLDGGLRPIWRYRHGDVVLHDLCRFRIAINGQGSTIDEPLMLHNLKTTPGFAEWKRDAEELFGPLHEYFHGP